MPAKRRKKVAPVPKLSSGPLPRKLAGQFTQGVLVFSDASQKRQGGLAAALFANHLAEPLIVSCAVPLAGSNELELRGAVFALLEAHSRFSGQTLALFCDNHDAVLRLNRAKIQGLAADPLLARFFGDMPGDALLANAGIHWVKAHATCRGNALADQAASQAAS